ncbi:DUF1366 domain-containing protein [Streptococcus suis]|uniref:DUF1366 domain-containing protein n=1 Tax=Streptococcus suis TaxID=1307 RepID=UPI001C957708|nr:DUF1366 domain-containing protein [Streptococcus suis]MBY4955850.1 DUF1366 domain-containing protein [Streptococcus suis]MBY5017017.1 DUF1366 domain-containing protein [Streptococcus suis]
MDFLFLQKSLEYHSDGSPKHTKLILTDELGSQFICHLPADSINKSNDELVQEGADDIYNRFFPKRAENERFTSIEDWLRSAETERNERFVKLEADMEAKIDNAVAELTVMFTGFAGQFGEEEIAEEPPKDTTPHDVEVEIEE